MAFQIGEISASITADDGKFSASMNEIRKKGARAADTIEKKFNRVGQKMRRIGAGMTAAITAPLVGVGTMAVKTAADYERLQVQIDTLAGSAEKGARIFKDLQEFSAGTPFQLKDLVKANNIMIGMGQSTENAFKNLKMLGDVASATGANVNELAVTFGQASAEGKLMTRDIREFINRGVPMTKLLADSMGVAKDEIFDLASQSKITFDVVQQALEDATSGTGIYANATEKAANTISGVWSTLKDNVDRALSELGKVIVDTLDLKQLAKDITANIQTITERFSNLSDDSQKQILKVAGLFAASGPLLMALGQAAIAISAFAKLVRTRFAALTASAAVFAGAVEWTSDVLVNAFSDSEREVKSFTQSAQDRLTRVIKPIIDFAEESIGAKEALENFQNLLSNLDGAGAKEAKQALSDTRDVLSFINGDVNALNGRLADVANNTNKTKKETKDAKKEWVALDGAAVAVKKAVDKILSSTAGMKDRMKNIKEILGQDLVEQDQFDLSKKIFPPGSLGALQQRLQSLREKLRFATDPEVIKRLQNQIGLTEQQIEEFSNSAKDSGRNAAMAMGSLGNSIGGVIGQLIRGKEEALSFGNILASVAPALINVLTGGSGGFISSLASGLFGGAFHSGGVVPGSGEKMALVEGGETIFTKGQMKAMGGMMQSRGTEIDYGKMKNAFQQAFRSEAEKLGPDEVFAMNAKGSRGF